MSLQYDVIIVGAGTAGLPCAIRAAQRGLSVLVIEKDKEPGGTLHITAGHLSAAGTKRQQQHNITDSVEEHWQDVNNISKKSTDVAIAKKAIALAPQTINWLQDLGYAFHEKSPVIIYGHEAYSKPRTYFGAADYFGGTITQPGKSILHTLLPVFNELVAQQKITLLCNCSLQKIIYNDDEVVGIIVQLNAAEEKYYGKNIVLATGGYAASQSFFKKHHPNLRLVSTAKATSTGDGIIAAIQAGALFTGAEKHISTLGGIELEPGSGRADFWQAWARVSNSHDRKPREIYVNTAGRRFMNEHDLTVDERERMVLQQSGQKFYAVFDSRALNDGACIVVQWDAAKFAEEAAKEKCCWSAASIETLAQKINVPAQNLNNTIQEYNAAVATQNDAAFGRTYLQHNLAAPPYYALLVYAYSLISFGGIKVNESLQVLRTDAMPIKNLYAAGEILGAGATSGNAFCGGMLLTPALSFGKWLGETL
jgi:flavocytochrome c